MVKRGKQHKTFSNIAPTPPLFGCVHCLFESLVRCFPKHPPRFNDVLLRAQTCLLHDAHAEQSHVQVLSSGTSDQISRPFIIHRYFRELSVVSCIQIAEREQTIFAAPLAAFQRQL